MIDGSEVAAAFYMKVYPYFYDLFGGLFFMEIMQVVGERSIKFKGNDGTEISGTNLYVIYDDNYTEGKKTDKLFVSDHLRSNINYFPKVGDEICVDFNRWGKISNITQMP